MAYARDHLAPYREERGGAESLLPHMYHGLLHEVIAPIAYPYSYPYLYPYPYP